MPGYTYDTGALIALERRDRNMAAWYALAQRHRAKITVPAIVLTEWWRGQKDRMLLRIVDGMDVEWLSPELAKLAGLALAEMDPAPSVVDAVVMASAAQRGDVVITSDFDDLQRLHSFFRAVHRIIRV